MHSAAWHSHSSSAGLGPAVWTTCSRSLALGASTPKYLTRWARGRPVAEAHPHAPEPQGRDLQAALAQLSPLHRLFLQRPRMQGPRSPNQTAAPATRMGM